MDFLGEKKCNLCYDSVIAASGISYVISKALEQNVFRRTGVFFLALSRSSMADDDEFIECFSSDEETKLFRTYSSLTLFSSLLCIDSQDEVEWPSLQSLHTQGQQQQQAFALRETSKDSGIHEMTEEKRRSAKRKEYVQKVNNQGRDSRVTMSQLIELRGKTKA